MTNYPTLAGRTVLLVEDESLVSLMAEDVLCEAGCVVRLAMRLGDGLALAESERLDLAILDVNLGGELSYPIAAALHRRGIPFFFATGYAAAGLASGYGHHLTLEKPYDPARLLGAASELLRQHGPGGTTH
jgi:DNA-binding response OmpR family regulator